MTLRSIALVAMMLAPAAHAEEAKVFTSSEWSMSRFVLGDDTFDARRLFVTGSYDFGDVALSGTWATERIFGGIDTGNLSFTGALSYQIADQIEVGLHTGVFDTDETGRRYRELSTTFEGENYWLTGFAGTNNDDVYLPGSYVGATGGYALATGTEVALSYYAATSGDLEDFVALNVLHRQGGFGLAADILARDGMTLIQAGAEFDVTPDVTFSLDLDHVDSGTGDPVDGITLGGAYDITGGLRAFASVSRYTGGGGEDLDGVTLGVTYDTGTPTLRRETTFERVVLPQAQDEASFRF